jgi:hypothetical protein
MNMVMAVYKGRLLGYKTFFYESLSTPIGVKLHKGEPVIIYGKNIRRFPIDMIEVLLYHELGHIACNHLVEKGDCIKQEHEADFYAAQRLGFTRVLEALRYTHSISGNKEILQKRIDYLQKAT